MRSRWLYPLLVVSLGLNIGLLLKQYTFKTPESLGVSAHAKHCGWHTSPLRDELNLNPEQAARMEEERNRTLEQVASQQETLRIKRQEIFSLFKNLQSPDEIQLNRLLREVSDLQAEIEMYYIKHFLRLKTLLSQSQLQKFEELFERHLCPSIIGRITLSDSKEGIENECPPGCPVSTIGMK